MSDDKQKRHYTIYRERKRAENEEEYLIHNAEIQKKWREKNKERVSEWRTNNINYRLKGIKQQSKKKNIEWCDTMSNEVCKELMTSPCFYCNHKSDKTVNGIDRMDSHKHYTVTNCVSCCKICNYMKTSLDVNTFIKRCKHISKHHDGDGELNYDIWRNTKMVNYSSYKSRAKKKNIEFELSKEEFNTLRSSECYYCGKENTDKHLNGIDRDNNKKGYTMENSLPCCGECNFMKNEMTKEEFIKQCKKIATYKQNFEDINDISECLSAILRI